MPSGNGCGRSPRETLGGANQMTKRSLSEQAVRTSMCHVHVSQLQRLGSFGRITMSLKDFMTPTQSGLQHGLFT